MIIEIDEKATLISRKADAVLLTVDTSGRDTSGLLKHWLDIAQVIEMMGMCKQINEETFLDFETEMAHIFVICENGAEQVIGKVIGACKERDVSSINVPSNPAIESTLWGVDTDADLLVRICGK